MKAPSLRYDLIADDKTAKGINSAKKNISVFEKKINDLGKTFASVFAAQKVLAFGKASAQAFMEDQKSAALLANTVKNLGLEFAQPSIDAYIKKLEDATGVVDEKLRPSMQKLLTTTGSIAKSQELLANAVDISRGSGVELETVVQDLTNAYVGNTKGLKKYNLGLTAAQLKAASFTDIQKKLNAQFTGASAAYLSTYAGKMELLSTAADNAKESIGKGLIDSLTLLGGNTDIQKVADQMKSLADYTSNALVGLADLLSKLKSIPVDKLNLGGLIPAPIRAQLKALDYLSKRGEKIQNSKLQNPSVQMFLNDKANQRAAAAQTKAANAQVKATKALTAEQKKQALLKKQSALFDLQQIELVAALKGKLSDEDRKRAELQLALLQGDEDTAKKLTAQIADAIDKTGNLKAYLNSVVATNDPFKNWMDSLERIAAKVGQLSLSTSVSVSGTKEFGGNTIGSIVEGFTPPAAGTYGVGSSAPTVVNNVTVQGNIIKEQELIDMIQNGTQLASLSGSPSQIGRIAGMFG